MFKCCLTFRRYRGDKYADGGPDERGGVAHRVEALRADEVRHLRGERPQVRLHVVLEDEAGERSRGLVLVGHLGQHVDQVRVEVRVAVQLLQLVLDGALRRGVGGLGLAEELQDLGQALILGTPVHGAGGGGGAGGRHRGVLRRGQGEAEGFGRGGWGRRAWCGPTRGR